MKQATPEIRSIVVAAYFAGKPRTEEKLFAATATALNAVRADDAQGWFDSCGYTAFKS